MNLKQTLSPDTQRESEVRPEIKKTGKAKKTIKLQKAVKIVKNVVIKTGLNIDPALFTDFKSPDQMRKLGARDIINDPQKTSKQIRGIAEILKTLIKKTKRTPNRYVKLLGETYCEVSGESVFRACEKIAGKKIDRKSDTGNSRIVRYPIAYVLQSFRCNRATGHYSLLYTDRLLWAGYAFSPNSTLYLNVEAIRKVKGNKKDILI